MTKNATQKRKNQLTRTKVLLITKESKIKENGSKLKQSFLGLNTIYFFERVPLPKVRTRTFYPIDARCTRNTVVKLCIYFATL